MYVEHSKLNFNKEASSPSQVPSLVNKNESSHPGHNSLRLQTIWERVAQL